MVFAFFGGWAVSFLVFCGGGVGWGVGGMVR